MPKGIALPGALLEGEPESYERALAIKFERARDDLDELDGAVLLSESGVYFALVYHLNAPKKGIEVVLNEKSKRQEWELNEAFRVMEAAKPRLLWKHPALRK